MSMVEKAKRRIWQIHLSTAMILTLVSATLMYLNYRPSIQKENVEIGHPAAPSTKGSFAYYVYGWPVDCYVTFKIDGPSDWTEFPSAEYGYRRFRSETCEGQVWVPFDHPYSMPRILINVMSGIGVLIVLLITCERSIRRLDSKRSRDKIVY